MSTGNILLEIMLAVSELSPREQEALHTLLVRSPFAVRAVEPEYPTLYKRQRIDADKNLRRCAEPIVQGDRIGVGVPQ